MPAFDGVALAIALLLEIAVDGVAGNVDLIGNKREQRSRRTLAITQWATGMAQVKQSISA